VTDGPAGVSGVPHLHIAGGGTDYAIRPIRSVIGGEAFELTKLEEDGATYHVILSDP
jgi:hypothetical protein